jgi:DGQHR domain-containing protein
MVELNVTAQVMKQNGYTLYSFVMTSKELKEICYVTPRSQDNPAEIQRLLDQKRAKAIGAYIKEEKSLLPNAIVISLMDEVLIKPTGNDKEVVITFPNVSGKYAYILDGQHRLGGFDYSDGIIFDMPVVAISKADENLRGKIFADINSKQVKVSDVHILSLYYQIKELPSEESATMSVVEMLNKDSDSPLLGKIQFMTSQKDFWVKNKLMKMCIAPYTESGGILHGKTSAQQTKIFKEYFLAINKVWPDAWGNNKEFMLTKPMGIEILMGIFASVKHRCDLNHGRQYTAITFEKSLEPLKGCNIDLPGGSITLSWQTGVLSALSNKVGRLLLIKNMKNILTSADPI